MEQKRYCISSILTLAQNPWEMISMGSRKPVSSPLRPSLDWGGWEDFRCSGCQKRMGWPRCPPAGLWWSLSNGESSKWRIQITSYTLCWRRSLTSLLVIVWMQQVVDNIPPFLRVAVRVINALLVLSLTRIDYQLVSSSAMLSKLESVGLVTSLFPGPFQTSSYTLGIGRISGQESINWLDSSFTCNCFQSCLFF